MKLPVESRTEAFLALGLLVTLTPRQKKFLLDQFAQDPLALLTWAYSDSVAENFGKKQLDLKSRLRSLCRDQLQREMESFARHGAEIFTWDDSLFPAGLKELPDPPLFIAVKGKNFRQMAADGKRSLAFVGSRNMSLYGQMMTRSLVGPLAQWGVNIVSGGALGVDAQAHRASLACEQGLTWCVLGHGFDHVYPSSHSGLFAEIAQRGCLISEYGCSQPARKFSFPQRNRLIAGLSQGVVVVEAHEKSGSLITAAFAADLGREVLAVPGNAQSLGSLGTHALIRQGAHLVTTPEDVFAAMGWEKKDLIVGTMNAKRQRVLQAISDQKVTLEDLMRILRWPLSEISEILLELEKNEFIFRGPQGRIIRSMQGSRALWQKP